MRGRSILFRMSALVLAAMLVMSVVAIAITFFSPPPFRPPVQQRDLIAAMQASPPPRAIGLRHVVFRSSVAPPAPQAGERADPHTAARIAAALGRPPSDIRFAAERSGGGPPRGQEGELRGGFTLAVRTGDHWRVAQATPQPWFTNWHRNALMWMMLAGALLFAIFLFVGRSITRPLRQLADDARHSGIDGPAFRADPSAPAEVRQLAAAIAGMRRRYAGVVANRTELLVGIAHDLGTPLTRLSFRIEALPDAARDAARGDIEAMQKLIAAALEFARGHDREIESVALDMLLADRVAALGRDAAPLRLAANEPLVVSANLVDLMRVIDNLIVNAQRHGGGAELALHRSGDVAELTVRDHGPGIDPAVVARLFEPLARGGQQSVGFGLGLAIVRQNVEALGGAIEAVNHPDGGALFTVRLPLLP